MPYDNEPGGMGNPNPTTGGNPYTLFTGTDANSVGGKSSPNLVTQPANMYGYPVYQGGGGGGNQHAAATANPAATAGPGSIGPDITLGPDGNVYGYSRQYDSATNSYSYAYKNLGPATDLATVSTASGIPTGMLQSAVQQQQVTLSNLAAQGAINPYVGEGQMTQQQLTQALDSVRTAQQYQSALAMQGVSTNGMTYAQMRDAYDQQSAAFNYATQGTAQAAQGYGWQRTNDQGANYNTASGVPGMTYGQLGISNDNSQAMQQYAYGQNYGTASGIGGMTYGQLGLQNSNTQAAQNYASGQNYNAANPYSGLSNGQTGLQANNVQGAMSLANGQNYYAANPYSGMSNGQTGLAASNSGDALSLMRNTYALTPSDYSGGMTRTAYQQGNTDRQDAYNNTQGRYNLSNQAADNQLRDLNRTYDTAAQQYNLGTAGYTNGQTRQQYQQGTQDTQNQYNRADSGYRLAHQGNQQALDTYQEATRGIQDTKNTSRNLTGLGWVGIGKPIVAGWT